VFKYGTDLNNEQLYSKASKAYSNLFHTTISSDSLIHMSAYVHKLELVFSVNI